MPASGLFDKRITIETRTETRGTDGGEIIAWSSYMASEPAMFKPEPGGEADITEQTVPTVRGTFTIRSSNTSLAITAAMRISFDSKYWNITNINPYGRKEYIELKAESQT